MITVVGSLNMDLVINTDVIPKPGETVLGIDFKKIPGGKGGNQASAAARLGSKVTMIGAVGKDELGEELILSLKKDGVKTDFILKKEETSTGIASIVVENQHRRHHAVCVIDGRCGKRIYAKRVAGPAHRGFIGDFICGSIILLPFEAENGYNWYRLEPDGQRSDSIDPIPAHGR